MNLSRARSAALTLSLGLASAAAADLVYTFDATAEGWSSINDTSFFGWDGTRGNPLGCVRGVDQVAGDIWFYDAPPADLGDLSSLYGRSISYQILGITGNHTSIAALADVAITGNGTRIGANVGVQPVNGQWTSWNLPVSAAAGWRVCDEAGAFSGTVLSEAQIRAVLADCTGLFIRGEYTNGSDSSALDNVIIDTGGCNDADFAVPFGALDFFDVQAFLQAFAAEDPSADLNNDGAHDFFDVQAFLTAFSAGCP